MDPAQMRQNLSGAVQRAGLEEMADSFVIAVLDGTFPDEPSLRNATYELVGKAYADPVNYGPPESTPGKPGCQCFYGRRNDVAWHVGSCPWRQARLRAESDL